MKTASIKAVFRSLHEADVRYIVVGGLAVIEHGFLRRLDVPTIWWTLINCDCEKKSHERAAHLETSTGRLQLGG